MTNGVGGSKGDVVILVGTQKGAFLVWADATRRAWRIDGPHFPGEAVFAMTLDQRAGRRRLLAGTSTMHWGAVIRASDDLGRTWTEPDRKNVKFPPASGLALNQIWQIMPGRASEPDVMYAGVEPAALFQSRDAGDTWTPVEGLLAHEHRAQWMPGGGGLCLHTILMDPVNEQRMLVAISTGGVYRTDDGGRSWTPRNRGVRAEFLPNKHPDFGQCVHKVVHHPARPERLFLQNHWGLYRSDDWGEQWTDIANGVPSDFGFAMAMHPADRDTVYIVPITADAFRVVPEAKMRVYRTRDAGGRWEPLSKGLPQENAYETVLRDGMATDSLTPAGVYVGTRGGKLFASANDGDDWMVIADALPSIACVKAAVLA